jgi:hypothetical protein
VPLKALEPVLLRKPFAAETSAELLDQAVGSILFEKLVLLSANLRC